MVLSLSWEDPLEEGPDNPPEILAWRISGTEEPGELQSNDGCKSWNMLRAWHTHAVSSCCTFWTIEDVNCRKILNVFQE